MSKAVASWIVAVCNFVASCLCSFVVAAILTNRSARKNAFSLYVAFMIVPDAIFTAITACYNTSLALEGSLVFPPMEVVIFVNYFNYLVNFYMNGVVTFEINKVIIQSNRRQRTQPPGLPRLYKQVIAVYLFSIIVSLWAALPVSWSLMDVTSQEEGQAILGSPPGGSLSFLAAVVITYLIILIPAAYVVFVSIRVWKKNLLPRKGRTRTLSLFFMRVIIVFLLFYIPGTTLSIFLARAESVNTRFWLRIVRHLVTPGQAFTTIYLVAVKDDIRHAIKVAHNRTIGQFCCRVNESASRRDTSHRAQFSGSVQVSGLNLNSVGSSSKALWPSTVSQEGLRSETSREKCRRSEWNAEDEYNDDDENEPALDTEKDIDQQVKGDERAKVDADNGSGFRSVNMAGELETSQQEDDAV